MMQMKTLKIFLILTLSLICLPVALADQQSQEDTPNVVVLHVFPHKNRPNAPAKYFIECYYSTGYIELVLPDNITQVTVRIKQSEDIVWNGFITSEIPYSVIPDFTGEFTLECEDDEGRIFTGTLVF